MGTIHRIMVTIMATITVQLIHTEEVVSRVILAIPIKVILAMATK
jgi:hypothetical protein